MVVHPDNNLVVVLINPYQIINWLIDSEGYILHPDFECLYMHLANSHKSVKKLLNALPFEPVTFGKARCNQHIGLEVKSALLQLYAGQENTVCSLE